MKKIIAAILILAGPAWAPAQENESWIDTIKYEAGDFTIQTPFRDPSVAFIYDFVGRENLLAIEGSILTHKKIKNVSVTLGGASDASNEGTGELRERFREFLKSGSPYIGLRYVYDVTKMIHVGAAVGRNFEEGKNFAGVKTSFEIRFW